jgi:hypothetical protein
MVAGGRAPRLGRASVKFRFPLMLVTVGCGSLCNLPNWIKRSATAVCAYYGTYPVSHVSLDVYVRSGVPDHASGSVRTLASELVSDAHSGFQSR